METPKSLRDFVGPDVEIGEPVAMSVSVPVQWETKSITAYPLGDPENMEFVVWSDEKDEWEVI